MDGERRSQHIAAVAAYIDAWQVTAGLAVTDHLAGRPAEVEVAASAAGDRLDRGRERAVLLFQPANGLLALMAVDVQDPNAGPWAGGDPDVEVEIPPPGGDDRFVDCGEIEVVSDCRLLCPGDDREDAQAALGKGKGGPPERGLSHRPLPFRHCRRR